MWIVHRNYIITDSTSAVPYQEVAMATFKMVAVINANTFEISPDWEYEGSKGNRVRAKGYAVPDTRRKALAAEEKLSILMQNKKIELTSPQGVDNRILLCEVHFQGANISNYFPKAPIDDDTADESPDQED